jgi:glycosyltransferase involved in cell wall biosynthesis
MSLPSPDLALGAGRMAEFMSMAAVVGEPLPPLYRTERSSEPLRLVYLMPRTGAGGGARVLLEHANHSSHLGATVTVVSHFPRPDWYDLAAEFVEVPFGQPLCQSVPPCDVIVAGYWDEVIAARRLGIAPVVHFEQGVEHLFDEVAAQWKPVISASLAAADWTITIGENTENALAERYGIFAHRIANAVDSEVFRPLSKERSKRTVVFVGSDAVAFKGIDIARRVARGLAACRPDVGVVWITPSPPLGAKMGETVVNPTQEVLARYVREASVYVGTSRYESWGLPALEAMASGTPVVSTNNGGILTFGRDGENCLLVAVDDAEALIAAVIRVLDDPELAEGLVSAGLETAALYNWSVITAELLERYRALVDSLPPAPPTAVEIAVDDLEFDHEEDRSRLQELVEASPYEHFAIPVSQPAYGEYRLVRWKVVAHKKGGVEGTGRAYLPARSEFPVDDATYQFGIDLLREGLSDAAFSWFAGQCQQSPEADQAILGRWVLLSLIEAGRASEALSLAATLTPLNAAYPDYYYLTLLAALEARRPVDVTAALEAVRLLGCGARFEEWLDRPGELLMRLLTVPPVLSAAS